MTTLAASASSTASSLPHSRFRATFSLNPCLPYEERPDPRALLERRLGSLSARNHQEMTHVSLSGAQSLIETLTVCETLTLCVCFVCPAAVSVGAEVSAALLPIGSFIAARSFQKPFSKGIDNHGCKTTMSQKINQGDFDGDKPS